MSLASLHRLSLLLGSSLERERECAAFMDWLRTEVAPRRAALFVAAPGRESLIPAAASGFRERLRGVLPAGHDPWNWLEAQKMSLPRGERYALPILLEGELFGLLAVISAKKGEALSEEQRLLDLALAYLAPILRNIEHYENVERTVEERTAQLRQSEARFRTLAETTATAIFVYSGEKFIYVNHATEELTGYTAEELLAMRFWDVVHPDFQEMIRQRGLARQRGEPVPSRYEFKIMRKDGVERWVDFTAGKIEWQGQPAAIGSAFDITERKAADIRLRSVVEQVPLVTYTESSKDGSTLFISPQIQTLSGYISEEWINDPNLWKKVLHPDDRSRVIAEDDRTNHKGEPFRVEYRLIARSGEIRWVRDEAVLIRDEGGAPLYWQGFILDITERKRAEDALDENRSYLKAVLNSVNDAVFVDDADTGEIIDVNPSMCEMYGYTYEEALRTPIGDLSLGKPPYSQAEALEWLRKTRETGPQVFEWLAKHKDGHTFWVEVSTRFVVIGGKNRFVVVVRDITARKHHERQLEAQAMLARALGESLELQPLLERLLEAARHAIPAAEKGSVLLLEADGRLRVRALNGYNDPRLKEFAFASDSGYSARAARERRPLLIADVRADPKIRYDGEIEEARQIHGAIAAPLLIQERIIGVLSLDSTRKNAFTQEDLDHLVGFAASAALVIENARLFEETRRRAEETASLLNASLSLSSLDLQETLHTIGQRARHLFAADGCRIFLLEPDGKTLRCVLALAESEVAFADLRIELGQGVTGHVALTGEAEIVNDMLNDPRAQTVPGTEEEPEAIMFAPLKSGEKTIGVISIRRVGSDRPFPPNDLDLLKAFASLAASAVSNARLFEEIQARLQELEILQTLSTSLRQAHHMEEMLPLFIQYAAQVVNAAAGSIYLWEEASGEWVSQGWMTTDGHWQTDTADLRHRPGEGVTGWVGERGEIYVTTDWRADATNQPLPHEVEVIQNLTGGISLPLKAEEHIIGILHLWYTERREFSAEDKRLLTAIADMAGNAIQRARLHEETTQQVKRLTALRDIDRAIASSFDLNLVFTFLLNGVLTQLNADATDILLFDSRTNTLYQAAKRGFRSARLSNVHLRLDESLAGRAALTRQLVAIPDFKAAGEAFTPSQLPEGENFKAYYAYPLVVKGELKGVLEVFHRAPLFVTSNWLDFFETLAGQAAIAIDNARLFENLERSNFELMLAYDETIEGWSRALDLRDKETEGHTRRVTELTLKLAAQLGVPSADLVHIRRGALLHDIGKVGVPDKILLKEGHLTDEEWAIMRQHPQFAYDMLAPIQYLRPALDIPWCHHEKWDGTGYPRGLQSEQIPLAARIFAVADVYDALTSDRPYRPAWTKEQALEYIREQTGKHFDPQVTAAFLSLIESEE
jgi:PAS domain S-box-containing protein/putative nucleotidyltransferase with HDIG domain